jgi:hypothetical protein
MTRPLPRLRIAALLAAGALGLHELRYRVGYEEHAEEALGTQGHGYLSFAGALVAVLLLTACLGFALSLIRAWRGYGDQPARPSLTRTWLSASAALSTVYAGQEWLEGLLAVGHPTGLSGIVAHGGWTAFLIAFVVAALVALLLRGTCAAIAFAAGRARTRRPRVRSRVHLRRTAVLLPPLAALARHLAARGPPPLLR